MTPLTLGMTPVSPARCCYPSTAMNKLRTCVFPCAGFGTRFFPATKVIPKEMLPLVDKPVIQYGVEEALESGLDKRFDQAPAFYWLYSGLIVLGAGVLLVPKFPLFRVMVFSQVVNGILLPFVLVFMLLLMNDRELMGEHVNSRWYNVVSWFTVGAMAALSIALLIAQARG